MEQVPFTHFIQHELSEAITFNDLSSTLQQQKLGQTMPINPRFGEGKVVVSIGRINPLFLHT